MLSIDFRCGIDKLAKISEQTSRLDSKCGALFMFRNRPDTSFKLLMFDGTGFWLCQKRLSQGRAKYWPKTVEEGHTHPAELKNQVRRIAVVSCYYWTVSL